MSVLKIKNEQGIWESVDVIKGDKGDIGPQGPEGPQGPKGDNGATYTAGTNIEITPENVINCTIKNTSELTNDSDFTTNKYVNDQIGNINKVLATLTTPTGGN